MMSSRRVAASVLVLSLFCLAASEADPDDNRFTGYANGSLITVAHTSFTQAGASRFPVRIASSPRSARGR